MESAVPHRAPLHQSDIPARQVVPGENAAVAWSDRGIALVLGVGVCAVVLVAMRWKIFELDRYFVPKEAVLNAAALLVGIGLLARRRRIRIDLIDALLLLFLGLSALSAVFAGNHWLAQRSPQ